ncbi:regulatory protein, Fis family [Desulfocicer vacuolatum DSM 3385]|uniref:Regulatory protein, Fis family n=1 Tax=Desulfocicer vacuolatum DSM 3385 TaxID=1121400 RepID=A0A1W2AYX8_9BACT|nr:sigma 54-interacting transcriptional regulator [Desulfocicer vacuolatum]SMC65824.1 regulatory protein, Fis family [Desulfocicer vacuolatum DSM 3385]
MLLRLALAIDDKKLETKIAGKLDFLSDLQIKHFGASNTAWQSLVRSCADIFLISDTMIPQPVESGLSILNNLPENPMTIILHGNESSADHARLLAAGADSVIYSGVVFSRLVEVMETVIDSRRQYNLMDRYDRKGRLKPKLSDFISESQQMQIFMEEVHQVVTSDTTLLILGETGVGKEHLAKAIHAESPRSNGPFIAVNTAALPEQLLESELFGHGQGAFTGAIRARRGSFELAHGGTIFLDEIGDMPLHLQTKLLRVLQEYEIVPIGSEEPTWVDVRVIAATNKDLEQEIEQGRFRRDLFYRISVISLTIPPLSSRKEDIPALIRTFISHYRKRIGRDVLGISDDAVMVMTRYAWPGNVRELMNVIERAMLLCRGNIITLKNLPEGILTGGDHENENNISTSGSGRASGDSYPLDTGQNLQDVSLCNQANIMFNVSEWEGKTLPQVRQEVVKEVEKIFIEQVLLKAKGRVGKAATMAGIHPRGLYSKMKQLGIEKERFKK